MHALDKNFPIGFPTRRSSGGREREKGTAQEHSQHKQMLEKVPKIQHKPGAGWQSKNARNVEKDHSERILPLQVK